MRPHRPDEPTAADLGERTHGTVAVLDSNEHADTKTGPSAPTGLTEPAEPDDLTLRGPSAGATEPADERADDADVVPIGAVPPARKPRPPRRRLLPAEPPADRLRGWVVTLVLAAIGGVIRFWDIGMATDRGTPIFDEKYYAINAAEMVRLGGIEENYGYGLVVHPPLGKQLIALSEWMFGYNPFGWRFASAIAGIICIILIIRVARRLTGSTLLGGIAGVLLICDGVSHVMARTALLDVFQEMFVLGAFATLLCDRAQVRKRLAAAAAGLGGAPGADTPWGIKLGFRWWRFATGVLLGCATAVKWSGIYWIAFFGVLSVIWDILARREFGVRRPLLGMLRRDALPSLWSYVVIGLGTYVASWWAWFASESAWARHVYAADSLDWHGQNGLKAIGGLFHNSFWQWTWNMLSFHSTLLTPGAPGAGNSDPGARHPWESKPWVWPMSLRPVLYYVQDNGSQCQGDCQARIFLAGTPAMWFIALPILGWALWKMIGRLDWRYAAVVVAYAAGYVPWFTNLDRQMYFFYATALAPFLILGIVLVLGDILGSRRLGTERRLLAYGIVAAYVGIVVANFIWMYPILNGYLITNARLTAEIIIPSWG